MVRSIGLDIVDLDRIEKNITQYGDRFISKILSKREQQILERRHDRTAFLAGRFAAKEAIIKALSTLDRANLGYREIEIINDKKGIPRVSILKKGFENIDIRLSLSHSQDTAIAFTIVTLRTDTQV